jgi:hypothetical protein
MASHDENSWQIEQGFKAVNLVNIRSVIKLSGGCGCVLSIIQNNARIQTDHPFSRPNYIVLKC